MRVRQRKSVLKRIIAVLVIFVIAALLAVMFFIPYAAVKQLSGEHRTSEVHAPSEYGISAENLTLTTGDGLKIAAYLTAAENPKGVVIILSGIDRPSVTAFFGYAKFFSDNGYSALLIETRGHNASEGESVCLGMKEWRDVKAGVDYLKSADTLKELPIIAMGTSMGAATVDVAAGEIPEIDAVISLSAFSSGADYFYDVLTNEGVPKFIAAAERPFVNLAIGVVYGFDSVKYTPVNGIAKIGNRPVLLMHSTGDTQVPYPSYERLFAKAQSVGANVTTFVREGDEHFICYDKYFDNPAEDTEFSGALLEFLNGFNG